MAAFEPLQGRGMAEIGSFIHCLSLREYGRPVLTENRVRGLGGWRRRCIVKREIKFLRRKGRADGFNFLELIFRAEETWRAFVVEDRRLEFYFSL